MGHSKSSTEREVHTNIVLHKEDRKISNKKPIPTSKRTRGATTDYAQRKYEERNIQDQSRIK